jgi:hypothetical protein
MQPGDVFSLLIAMGLPTLLLMFVLSRYFRLKERKLDVQAQVAAEKAAQYAAHTKELAERVRVLEQIVTDGGMQTAAQIEALREKPRIAAVASDDAAA